MTHPDKPTAARELAEAVRAAVNGGWSSCMYRNGCLASGPFGVTRSEKCGQCNMAHALSRFDAAREVWEDEAAVRRAAWEYQQGGMPRALRAALEGGDDADA